MILGSALRPVGQKVSGIVIASAVTLDSISFIARISEINVVLGPFLIHIQYRYHVKFKRFFVNLLAL